MSYDLVIKNGTVVDGTGAKRYQADVGHRRRQGRRDRQGDGRRRRTIDADGWSWRRASSIPRPITTRRSAGRRGSPSSWHGVTSVVMGNCGVGHRALQARDAARSP